MNSSAIHGVDDPQFCRAHTCTLEYFLTEESISDLIKYYQAFLLERFPCFTYVSQALNCFFEKFERLKCSNLALVDMIQDEEINILEKFVNHIVDCFGDVLRANEYLQLCSAWLKVF